MNAERNQFVAFGNVHSRRTNASDEFRGYAMDLESNQLVRVQALQVFRFDVPREFQADVVDGHRQLPVFVNSFESQRLHLLRIFRINYEMKQSSAFTIMQKPFAFELSGVPRDREMNLLPPGLGKIQPGKIAHRPL